MILYITILAIMFNGQVEPQRTTIDFESFEDCTQAKLEMSKSLDTQMNKTIIGYSMECNK